MSHDSTRTALLKLTRLLQIERCYDNKGTADLDEIITLLSEPVPTPWPEDDDVRWKDVPAERAAFDTTGPGDRWWWRDTGPWVLRTSKNPGVHDEPRWIKRRGHPAYVHLIDSASVALADGGFVDTEGPSEEERASVPSVASERTGPSIDLGTHHADRIGRPGPAHVERSFCGALAPESGKPCTRTDFPHVGLHCNVIEGKEVATWPVLPVIPGPTGLRDVHRDGQAAHDRCDNPADCECECRVCKRVWWAAGRPRPQCGYSLGGLLCTLPRSHVGNHEAHVAPVVPAPKIVWSDIAESYRSVARVEGYELSAYNGNDGSYPRSAPPYEVRLSHHDAQTECQLFGFATLDAAKRAAELLWMAVREVRR